MTRIARNPGTGKPPHNGPAKGRGWGSPEQNGLLNEIALPPQLKSVWVADSPIFRSMSRVARIDALKELLWLLATDADFEMTRLMAAERLLDREEGKPVQRVVNTTLEGAGLLTHEQRVAVLGTLKMCLDGPEPDALT